MDWKKYLMITKKRYTLWAIALTLLTAVLLAYATEIKRLYLVITLYDEDKIVYNFLNMHKIFHATELQASTKPFKFQPSNNEYTKLPTHFRFADKDIQVADFLKESRSTGLLVIKNDHIITENYYLGHSENKVHTSFSMSKSFISALFGIAIKDGYIANIEQSVTDYVPQLKGSGYDGVRIKDVLQMSSGVEFNEDYGDFHSDINRFGRSMAFGTSLDEFAASLKRGREPGTYNHYVSIDTQVLGMILTRATGLRLSDYLQDKIWQPLGMEQKAYWVTDDTGMEVALCCLSVGLKDYAKLARLYLHQGNWNGQQIIPAQWVKDSTFPDAPHLMAGVDNPHSSSTLGYGFQWWLPLGGQDEFMAIGIYGQYIYIDPDRDLIIVKNSANHRYTEPTAQWTDQHLALFRAISQQVKETNSIAKIEPH
ncbi:MAG: CubicO group peptidase (beta-lactamase class C family) [Paraglaciecola sp.]|jgi:CubicO group peptidase (beta-lactamase class C family)